MNLRLMAIIGGSFAFTAAITALVVWVLVSGEKAASDGSKHFAAALVGGPAPKGTDEYVRGVRSRFGEIGSARVIDTRNHRVGRGNSARTYHRSDVLLQTATGPAVIELEFDGMGIISKDISEVYELAPRDVPDDALSDDEFVALAKAYARRGGYASADLGVARTEVPTVVKQLPAKVRKLRPKVTPSPELRDAQRRLKCVQKAKGDVEKLAACA